ncbi:MAG: phosphate acyltransferase [Bacteroidota bacterium]|jgi:phosphotransacetylase|nr:phosphate butyryltransferase [Bacteroidales bacterium]MDI9534736.1 phosphate acyltransferase [Bacteroidota bacterium]OQC46828.1 MAG: Phosphate acetyltransferase [Bacteroidetes bacterium ADurb.Bin028]NLP19957.1 phosphate butyryltransferase [Bacteroidales bacterium]HOD88061.1 phosphate acyltransferase [Bacteroidales bacterium]
MNITKLDDIIEVVKSKSRKRLSVAFANDAHTIEAVSNAIDLGIVEGILVGDTNRIEEVCKQENIDVKKFKIVHETDETKAANLAVKLINDKEADFLMKGLVSTDKYMRAILNKETGLLPPKATLSHVVVMELERYPKLLVVSDVAVIPYPDLNQKIQIANYVINVAHDLGIEQPRLALIAATEQVSASMPSCVDAAIISKMAERGQIKGALVDGPLALDVAIDKECVEIKKLKSVVAGQADCLVFPNIEAANVFYKGSVKLAGAKLAAMLVGAKCPAVLSSRGDSAEIKTYSIALAALSAK